MSTWIDCDTDTTTGTVGYLVHTRNGNTGRESWSLRERPLRTNQSHEPRISGWCGETDNQSRTAHGVVRVVALNKAGDRARIVKLDGEALVLALRADGHPDLVPGDLASLSESIEWGEDDGAEEAVTVHNEQGVDALRTSDHGSWSEAAAAARTHAIRDITDETEIAAYYRAYERSARAAVARLFKTAA